MVCEACGAPLRGSVCDYCGSRYTGTEIEIEMKLNPAMFDLLRVYDYQSGDWVNPIDRIKRPAPLGTVETR